MPVFHIHLKISFVNHKVCSKLASKLVYDETEWERNSIISFEKYGMVLKIKVPNYSLVYYKVTKRKQNKKYLSMNKMESSI